MSIEKNVASDNKYNAKNVKVFFDGKELKGVPYAPIYIIAGEEVDREAYIQKLRNDHPGITDDEIRSLLPLEE